MNRLCVLAFVGLGFSSVTNAASSWYFGGSQPALNCSGNACSGQDVNSNSLTVTPTGGGVNITATGYYNLSGGTDAPRDLFKKYNADPNERGLGFTNDTFGNFEIDTSGFIVLNLSDSSLANVALALSITSIQSGESYAWYHGNSFSSTLAFGGLTLGGTGLITSPLLFTGGSTHNDQYIAIEASSHNVLINTLTTGAGPSTVPEPRFYGLLLAGLLGLAGTVYRRRRVTE